MVSTKNERSIPNKYYTLKDEKYENYIKELNKLGYTKTNRYDKPLHLYCFYVYLAYTNS